MWDVLRDEESDLYHIGPATHADTLMIAYLPKDRAREDRDEMESEVEGTANNSRIAGALSQACCRKPLLQSWTSRSDLRPVKLLPGFTELDAERAIIEALAIRRVARLA
jgi:hypothetical protein